MQNDNIYNQLGYTSEFLTANSEIANLHPDYADLVKLEADKFYFSGNHPAVLFVNIKSFSSNDELRRIAAIQHKAWNYRKVILLFAVSETEIRIYNCYEKPTYINGEDDINLKLNTAELLRYDTTSSDVDTFNILVEIFSRIGVDNGLLWTEQPEIRKKIDLQNRIDAYLVKSLIETAKALEKDGLNKEVIHSLLMRSLFILFLEDKGAANEAGLYTKIKSDCSSYFDILDSKEATYKLFEEVQIHFNGNVTPVLPNEKELVTDNHLKLIKRCFIDGNISDNETLFKNWRLFNFEIIQIELLSEIYENFLGELKHERGQFYTPYNLVELILSDKLPISKSNYNVKILDPACGSGSLLLKAEKILGKDAIRNGFYGQEINITTYNLCRINMFLHDVGFDKFDIACEDTLLSPQHWDDEPFELIVSNPPYSIKWAGNDNPLLINDPRFAPAGVLAPKGKADMAFIMHSLSWLASNGTAAIVCFPGIMYRGGAEQKIRKYLVDNNYIDCIIQLPSNLFFGTSIATCIMVMKKNKTDNKTLFIDATSECVKVTNNNKLTPENIDRIVDVFAKREEVEYFAHLASYEEVSGNDYNLSVSTYVEAKDTREKIDIVKLNAEIKEIVAREQVLRDEIDKIIAEIEV